MRNIDKIRAMSAEQLVLEYQSVRPCEVCSYFEGDECSLKGYAGERECNGGRIKWLEQEVKPIIPELQAGDIIHTKLNQYVVTDDKWMVCPMRREKIRTCEIEKYATYIYRSDSNGHYQEIWRAEE
jgi:hypothetical protein